MRRLFLLVSILFFVRSAWPCSRILWEKSGQGVIVGRTMDWFQDTHSNLWLFPRGVSRNGLAQTNPIKWTSKYGSVGFSIYDAAIADGMNEAGLNANLLYLTESDFGKRVEQLPGLSVSLWVQYVLDNYATVDEALQDLEKHPIQVLMASTGGKDSRKGTVHLSLADKTGDSAIIEYVGGKPSIYHGREYRVMTNSPTFDLQIKGLKRYKGFGGDQELPGTTQAADRFVRAAYYLEHLPEPKNDRESIAGVFSVIRNVSQPFGVSDPSQPNISPTRWRVVADLPQGIYYYESVLNPNVVWIKMSELNFSKGKPISKINLNENPNQWGDISKKFKPAHPLEFIKPDES